VIDPHATIRQAARVMAENKIGCLPVVEDEELVGIVTETDVLRWIAESGDRATAGSATSDPTRTAPPA